METEKNQGLFQLRSIVTRRRNSYRRRQSKQNFGKEVTDRKWTNNMKGFQARLGKNLGYEVKGLDSLSI